ncbi:geranylgeranyl transferase type-2 subunit alpha 1 [Silene latifolia]|uniref:geranylgeranyl transferase type-2 subunit alpha 1 n=1 Tax=Silene latifolia TaxID=37657 RepID=UPI003D782F62
MHGRPRKASKPEDEAASAAKASKLRSLQSQFLHFHHNHIYDKEAIEVSSKLVELNPEYYTAWNFRKLAVDHLLAQPLSDPNAILNEELRVAESALRQNFKSYGAWHHRKWVLTKGHSSVDLELRLLDKFQKADSRNFHAWNYRRYVAALNNIADEDELKYTTNMIETNFSNYSAWHNRSVLLSSLLKRKAEGFFPKEKILTNEFELVHQAIFTDPDDQSGWFYHLWLLEQTVKEESPWLISSWPAFGSTVSPLHSADGNTLPLVLYFSQPVRGVNSSSVTVTTELTESKDLTWRPLSLNDSEGARSWVALLKCPSLQSDDSTAYPVEVNLRHSLEIVSLGGCPLSSDFQTQFVVCFQQPDRQHVEEQEPIIWEDSNFQKTEMNFEESDLIPSFNELQINKDQEAVASKWQVDILNDEIVLFRELLSAMDCKIGKLTLAKLLMALDTIFFESSGSKSYKMVHVEEILALYSDLMKLDPSHLHYYKEQHSLALLQQITSSKDRLLRYCWCYKNSRLLNDRSVVWLRLNNQSLSQIGCIERLLWVQNLDLSHNELGSLEGLEAMQLLECLNLSSNKIKSFTALAPLRHMKLLKVLNISNNEIGQHTIDTTRYLCPSPLSNDWKAHPCSISSIHDPQLLKYFDAFLIFRDLTLIQLDISGNAVVEPDFTCFIRKVIPTLKWVG